VHRDICGVLVNADTVVSNPQHEANELMPGGVDRDVISALGVDPF
jgi:hypothetical protein